MPEIESIIAELAAEDPMVRFGAAWALTESRRPEAFEALVEWLEREEIDWIVGSRKAHERVSLFDRLVAMKPPATHHLVRLLSAQNATVRWRAAVWLARRGDAAAADTLAFFVDAPDDVPKTEAALIVPNLGFPPVASNEDPDTLVEAVTGLDWTGRTEGGSVRVAAAWALGLIGEARALPVLLPLVMHGRDAGSIVPAVERCLERDAASAAEADLRTAATLTAPAQVRGHGDDSQFGPGPGVLDLGALDLARVHGLARGELERRRRGDRER